MTSVDTAKAESKQSPSSSAAAKTRTRKRSLFGKAPKPPLTAKEPLPTTSSHAKQTITSTVSAKPNKEAEPEVLVQQTKSAATTPVKAHRRSPSTSLFSRRLDGDLTTTESHSPSSNAQSLGRRAAANAAQSNPWYQRGPLSKASSLSNISNSSSRDRSASVSVLGSTSRAGAASERIPEHGSPERDQSAQRWSVVPDSSPSRLVRSFSRRSVYSIQGDPAATANLDNRTVQGSDTGDEALMKEPRRSFFSRKSRTHGISDSSSDVSDQSRPSNVSQSAGRFLRRASSRSLLGKEREMDPARSTDSLVSTGTTGTSRGLSKRASDIIHKTTVIAHWSRKNRSTTSVTEDATSKQPPQSPLPDQSTSVSVSEEAQDDTIKGQGDLLCVPQEHDRGDIDNAGEGVSRRLSGWLFHMLNNDASQASHPEMSTSASNATIKKKSSWNQLQKTEEASSGENALSSATQIPANKGRAGGLLSSLAASGRNRLDGNPTSTSPARSGLDRALRYFIDGNETESSLDEGIWLLGVWHGPSSGPDEKMLNSSSLGPAIEVSHASPDRGVDRETTATESSKPGSDFGHDDDSSITSNAQRTRETSPSIASIHSGTSANEKKDSVGAASTSDHATRSSVDDGPIVARNPPTPHTSPTLGQPRTSAVQSRLGREIGAGNGATARLLAAIAVAPDKSPSFQADFASRIWCTYRSHFSPISRDGSISQQAEQSAALQAAADEASIVDEGRENRIVVQSAESALLSSHLDQPHHGGGLGAALGMSSSPSRRVADPQLTNSSLMPQSSAGGGLGERMGIPNLWNRATAAAQAYGLTGRSGLTTDAGWGCMLRTGQSVLANALLSVHLGRTWRRVAKPLPVHLAPLQQESQEAYLQWHRQQEQYGRYVRLLSWFMDDPSLNCPFGVHRMAREGKRLGKEVGEWFGPSTAAGAIKKLVDDFPECEMGVTVATDGVVYLNQVKAAAQRGSIGFKRSSYRWERPVLILIGIRLGLEGVHPMYHESVKATFALPQSCGIAGGRPSSSYYFVGYQGNSLFYLDPHHVRSSVPFRHAPAGRATDYNWWAQAYSEHDLATFHNDRPRRMPMKSLDPSMLLGFLIQDEEALDDFLERVKALPRPIFSVQESMPKWMMEDDDGFVQDDERAIESISESSTTDEIGNPGNEQDLCTSNTSEGLVKPLENHTLRGSDHEDKSSYTGVTTPRSEATFELIDRQPPSASTRQQSSPPMAAPIAFPSFGSFDDTQGEDDVEEEVVGDGRDKEEQPQREEGEEELMPRQDEPQQPHASPSANDIESAWEDLQDDILASPIVHRTAQKIHALHLTQETLADDQRTPEQTQLAFPSFPTQ